MEITDEILIELVGDVKTILQIVSQLHYKETRDVKQYTLFEPVTNHNASCEDMVRRCSLVLKDICTSSQLRRVAKTSIPSIRRDIALGFITPCFKSGPNDRFMHFKKEDALKYIEYLYNKGHFNG